MTNYRGNFLYGFIACGPYEVLPEWVFAKVFCPAVETDPVTGEANKYQFQYQVPDKTKNPDDGDGSALGAGIKISKVPNFFGNDVSSDPINQTRMPTEKRIRTRQLKEATDSTWETDDYYPKGQKDLLKFLNKYKAKYIGIGKKWNF